MLIVPERDIPKLMTPEAAFDAVEKVFAAMAAGQAYNFQSTDPETKLLGYQPRHSAW